MAFLPPTEVGWGTKFFDKKLGVKAWYRYNWDYNTDDDEFERGYEMIGVSAKYKF